MGGHLASVQIEEDAHALRAGVDALQPAVERLVKVVEVVLSEAATLAARAGSVCVFHANKPAVVLAHGLWEVATTAIKGGSEVACTDIDVGPGIPAAVRSIAAGTFVGSDLHEPLLAIAADYVGIAGGLLHGNSGEENGWDVVLAGGPVEGIKVRTAGVVGVAGLGEDVAEVLGDHLVDREVGRIPATAVDTTVEPTDRAIGAARLGGIG